MSPGSTLNKSSSRCTPTIVTTDSETEQVTCILDDELRLQKTGTIARSESKDDGMDCNYASDEEDEDDEPIYENGRCGENNVRNLKERVVSEDCSNNNVEV